MKVKITDGMREHARWAEEQLVKVHPKPTYTKLQAPSANYCGVLGELAFAFALHVKKKRGMYKPLYDGKSDRGDILVKTVREEWVPLDVKTASKPSHKYLMTPKVQYDKPESKNMVYVGVRIHEDMVEILGFAYHRELELMSPALKRRLGLKIETMCAAFEDLRPIEDMLKATANGTFIFKVPRQEKLV